MSDNKDDFRYGIRHVMLYDPFEGMSKEEIEAAKKKVFDEAWHHCGRCEKNFQGKFEYWVEGELGLFFTPPDTKMILMCPGCIEIMKASEPAGYKT